MSREISTLDRSIYIHQFNYGTAGADWADIVARCKNAGANLIKLKALDGPDWLGAYDIIMAPAPGTNGVGPKVRTPAKNAVTGPDQWTILAEGAQAQGLELIPWCVPHGDDLDAELAAIDALANISHKRVELDLEPYAGFWLANTDRLVTLVTALFARSIEVWVDIDPRPYAVAALHIQAIQPYITRWLSQSYWTTFRTSAGAELTAAGDLFVGLPAGDWGAILPASGAPDFQAGAQVAADRDAVELGFWSYNVAGQSAFDAFRDIH